VTYRLQRLATVYGWRMYWRLTTDEDRRVAAEAMVKRAEDVHRRRPRVQRPGRLPVPQAAGRRKPRPSSGVFGLYVGAADQGRAAIQPLRQLPGAVFELEREGAYSAVLAELLTPWPYFPGVEELCDQTVSRYSAVGSTFWTSQNWKSLLDSLIIRPSSSGAISGSKPTAAPSTPTGPWTTARSSIATSGSTPASTSSGTSRIRWAAIPTDGCAARCRSRPTGRRASSPPGTIASTRTIPSRCRTDAWAEAYWGQALPALVAVKKKYDPQRHFDFPQAIPTRAAAAASWPSEIAGLVAGRSSPRRTRSVWSNRLWLWTRAMLTGE
jgi:hypothetical protein